MIYNLQYFAEEETEETPTEETPTEHEEVDVGALADLIAEKDKQITECMTEIAKLKRTNAQMLVQINAGSASNKSFDDMMLELAGDKPRKE